MKFHCIADEDTVRGFRLAGATGTVASSAAEATACMAAALAQPDCGIIILTQQIADGIRPLVEQIRFERERPLIVEIAGPEGAAPGRKSLRQLVQEAVGLHLDSEKGN
ncbi:MAG TPA: V-type ATP synthase subunit F [Candidatus Acidoferrales bacterium]|nr:V-type ATP synthase subunit F [Candidatus Acidoferrales bacterium]